MSAETTRGAACGLRNGVWGGRSVRGVKGEFQVATCFAIICVCRHKF